MDQTKNDYISPIRSNESDIDDSDANQNFDVSSDKLFSNRLIPTTKNSSSSSNISSSTSTDSSDSPSESTVSNIEDNGEKKGKKRVRKPENWQIAKTNLAKQSSILW
ncbi:unnamed protein product [Diabrotica balteata]|uniref:Uncharacterized protein n=1 Tax=Diabrotica balteata TaxID=107213 RepID=A0A9N9SYT3_DIABA|nr:unnamed protein product [Diabrotica balteata]